MIKVINNNNVSVDEALFNEAYKGICYTKHLENNIKCTICENSLIADSIKEIDNVYNSLPFPLSAIENDMKYYVIGKVIKSKLKIDNRIAIDKSLYIELNEKSSIRLVGKHWCIVEHKDKAIDIDDIQIEKLSKEVGYKQYNWIMEQLIKGESVKEYYKKFMGDMLYACNNNMEKLNKEIQNILIIDNNIPDKLQLKDNILIDVKNGVEYSIDLYCCDKFVQTRYEHIISREGCKKKEITDTKYEYDFSVLSKVIHGDGEVIVKKIKKTNRDGLVSIYEQLLSGIELRKELPIYKGVIVGNNVIYKIDNRIMLCKLDKYSRSYELGSSGDIYGVRGKDVYIVNDNKHREFSERRIYKLDTSTMNISLSAIKYVEAR